MSWGELSPSLTTIDRAGQGEIASSAGSGDRDRGSFESDCDTGGELLDTGCEFLVEIANFWWRFREGLGRVDSHWSSGEVEYLDFVVSGVYAALRSRYPTGGIRFLNCVGLSDRLKELKLRDFAIR